MHQPSPHPDLLNVPIIAIKQPLRDPLIPLLPAKHVHVPMIPHILFINRLIDDAETNELRVPLHTDLEPTDLIAEANDLGAAPRGEVEDLLDAQLCPFALLGRQIGPLAGGHGAVVRDEGGLARGLEDAGAVAAAHVGAEAEGDALVEQPADVGLAARQGRVAAGAVGDLGAAAGDEVGLVVAEVDGVGEDRLFREEAVGVVDAGVVFAVGKHVAHELDLVDVLRDMRLHR